MAVIVLVPETKMADVDKLISVGNLLVRKISWFSSQLLFCPVHLEPTDRQGLPIYALVFQEIILFHIFIYRDNTLSISPSLSLIHFDFKESTAR